MTILIREPAVSGQFYAANAAELATTVTTLLDEVEGRRDSASEAPKALIVPHAGYIYSGPVATSAYASLQPWREQYDRVVLLGPCHRVPVRGMALSGARAFRTPIGDVPIDTGAVATLVGPTVEILELAHQYEHSLEVHLPFLQAVLGSFSLVPIVVGDAPARSVADVLDKAWGGKETLIVVSSDLSHYLPYEKAKAWDVETCNAIENLDFVSIDHEHACGATPVNGLLIVAKRRGMHARTLDLRNSADTRGEAGAVVGYGAWALS